MRNYTRLATGMVAVLSAAIFILAAFFIASITSCVARGDTCCEKGKDAKCYPC